MFLRQLHDESLAHSSYMIGCREVGEAIVVDPLRDTGMYATLAAREGLRIVGVAETHVHADFVSGARALAARTGATIYLSGEGGTPSVYRYATRPSPGEHVQLLHDGDRIALGRLLLEVWCTPGHTPEHISFLVSDTRHHAGPMSILTGDLVLVGDVGRPELREHATSDADAYAREREDAAQELYDSLRRFSTLPDYLQVLPAHSAAARSGRMNGSVATSTVGYEKRTNWALRTRSEAEFIDRVIGEQRDSLHYFARMQRVNREGPVVTGSVSPPRLLDPRTIERHVALSAPSRRADGRVPRLVVDLRSSNVFAGAHIPGSISIPFGRQFAHWAGDVLPDDAEILLLSDEGYPADAVRALSLIGHDRVVGWMDETDAATAWRAGGRTFGTFTQFDIRTLANVTNRASADMLAVVDVCDEHEWHAGHLPDAVHMSLARIAANDPALPERPFAVYCETGARSVIAVSLLHRLGRTDVMNLSGGYAAWKAAGLPSVLEKA